MRASVEPPCSAPYLLLSPMRHLHLLALFLTLFLAWPLTAAAQGSNNYGSPYSRFGLGERFDGSTSQASMMGVSGVAIRSGLYNSMVNPALASDHGLTTFSASGAVTGLRSINAADSMSRATAGDLRLLQLGVPLSAGRLGLSLAYQSFSRVNYRTVQAGTFTDDQGREVGYRTNYEGDGGLQEVSAGLGLRLGPALQVGASADVLFGQIEYLRRTEFPNASTYQETREATSTQMRGVTGTLGATLSQSNLFNDTDIATVGASIRLPARLTGTRVRTLGRSLDRDTVSTSAGGGLTVPLLVRGGIAYRRGASWMVSADALYEPWSRFESDFSFGGYNPDTNLNVLQDRIRVGAGIDVIPSGDERQAGYFARTAYRLGGYIEQGAAMPTGSTITTMALTAGLALPTRLRQSRFDLGFEVGTRGSTEGVLVRDVFVRGTVTFNFGERWFLRRRID